MRITKGAPAFAGSPDTVSYLLSIANLANFFSGTTWDWTGCCLGPACCEPTETAIKTTSMSSIDMPLPMMSSCCGRLAYHGKPSARRVGTAWILGADVRREWRERQFGLPKQWRDSRYVQLPRRLNLLLNQRNRPAKQDKQELRSARP